MITLTDLVGVRTALICFVFVALDRPSSADRPIQPAQDWHRAVSQNLTPERVIGLLNLPEVIGDGCGPAQPKTVNLYDSRSISPTPAGSITLHVTDRQPDGGSCGRADLVLRRTGAGTDEELPAEESDYEVPAAVVYERSGSWFRIAVQRGSGWVSHENGGDFQRYPDALEHKLSYLRESWDGRLWRTPGSGAAARIPSAWMPHLDGGVPVQVLEVRRVRNEVWTRVRLETERCGETLKGVSPTTGWIPAYQASGRTSLWFYSRGC